MVFRLGFFDPVTHFSTFGKNYKRRFEGTDLFEQIFLKILFQCMRHDFIDSSKIFIDATYVKAAANRKKAKKILVAKKSARFYDEQFSKEINADRESYGKKPLKDKNEDDDNDDDHHSHGESSNGKDVNFKEKKVSITDPESAWFHKCEHKEVFAYSIEAHVINMVGYLDIQFILEMSMTL